MFIGNKIKSIENITMKHGDKRKVCVWCNLSAIPWNSRELYGGMLQSHRAFCPRFPSCCWLFACLEFHSPGIIFSSLLFINAGILTMMSLTPFKTLQRILGQKPLSPSVLRKSKSSSEQEGSCEAHTADRMPGWLECLALGEYFVLPALATLPAAGAKQLHDSRGQPWPGVAALMVSVRVPVAPSCLNLKHGHFLTHWGPQPCCWAEKGRNISFLLHTPAHFTFKQRVLGHASQMRCKDLSN